MNVERELNCSAVALSWVTVWSHKYVQIERAIFVTHSWCGVILSTTHLQGGLRHSLVQNLTGIDDGNPAKTLASTGKKRYAIVTRGHPILHILTMVSILVIQGAWRTSSGRGMRASAMILKET